MAFFPLVSVKASRDLDADAQAEWGFNAHALIEAAGRNCVKAFTEAYPVFFRTGSKITVAAGTGNNAADAMVMLRCWIIAGYAEPSFSALVLSRYPKNDDSGPWVDLVKSLKKMNVPISVWKSGVWNGGIEESSGPACDDVFYRSDLIIDGIAGTGLAGALHGPSLEMVIAINSHKKKNGMSASGSPALKRPFVVSVDIPSGISDNWEPPMPVIEADITLAIEPVKYCIYTPAARPYAGKILPIGGIFPEGIIDSKYRGVELFDWEKAGKRIPKIRGDAYKNERGTVEIRAGSRGLSGAAILAARGAQAAGAGLIRLVVDEEIYPILASQTGGIMVQSAGQQENHFEGPQKADAILLGPGWGKKPDRKNVFEKALECEKAGVPLILDADAIELAQKTVFNGNTILTPHPLEFSRFTGIEKGKLLANPASALAQYSRERKALIIFKGHVITIAAPDGRMGVVDGMAPSLAAGGSGDLLAGFCAAIAARMTRAGGGFDSYDCAAAASSLLIASGKSPEYRNRFADPIEIALSASSLAGAAWLCTDYQAEETYGKP